MDPSGFSIGTIARAVPILLFFPPIFLSNNSFILTHFSSVFCLKVSNFAYIIPISETCVMAILEYFITDDCSIRVS